MAPQNAKTEPTEMKLEIAVIKGRGPNEAPAATNGYIKRVARC
jgi:hypothetical protein